jgi:CTP synthase
VEGKIAAIRYARENKIPYLGLCYGMQLAVIEFARHVAGLKAANTTEIDPRTKYPVIHIMPEQAKLIAAKNYGNSMRLGAYPCKLNKQSKVYKYYGIEKISERHRHRYEFNNDYRQKLESLGLRIAGTSPDNKLVEIVELPNHPFFVGSQFHPEFKSRPLQPHPLFRDLFGGLKEIKIKHLLPIGRRCFKRKIIDVVQPRRLPFFCGNRQKQCEFPGKFY